ncbi:DUF2633 family protein [Xenorhabdus beddingii]|nr:DUF2633 family protein [Xenorhabdus beddingii]
MTKLILLISFLILFGRFIYSFVAALDYHQQTQQKSVQSSDNPQSRH